MRYAGHLWRHPNRCCFRIERRRVWVANHPELHHLCLLQQEMPSAYPVEIKLACDMNCSRKHGPSADFGQTWTSGQAAKMPTFPRFGSGRGTVLLNGCADRPTRVD